MKRNRNQSGFTLMEAMMAVFVLAIAASGISMAFAAAGAVQTEAQRRILASRLAANVIEKIVSVGYVQVKTTIDQYNTNPAAAGILKDFIDEVNPDFSVWSCDIQYGSDVSVAGGSFTVHLIQVTVIVKYKNQELTRMTTLIGDKDKH